MVCIKSVVESSTKQLTSLFSSISATTSASSSVTPSSTTTPIQRQTQDDSKASTATTICKRRRNNGGRTANVLFLVLLDLWRAVPIIILITTTATPTTVSAVSIAAVSIASNAYGEGKGNGVSNGFDNPQHHHHRPGLPPQPNKLSFHSGNDAKGNGSSVGVLNLSFGELSFANRLKQQERKKEMGGKSIKNKGAIVKRNVGDTRVISNQDVTTLALAVENSTSVAIANINSSHNSVHVSIGPNRFEPGNRFETHSDEDYDDE